VNSHIRGVADGYAADGYLALAPAFFRPCAARRRPRLRAGRHRSRPHLHPEDAMDKVMLDAGRGRDNVESAGKVGIVGYCWGGTVSWMAAARLAGLCVRRVLLRRPASEQRRRETEMPVMFHWGEIDQSIPIDAAKKPRRSTPARNPSSIRRPRLQLRPRGSYHAESAKLARSRTLEFLRKHIG